MDTKGFHEPLLDVAHRCLANDRRRAVIGYLRRTEDGTAGVDDLSDYVVAREPTESGSDREAVAAQLFHVHLPMLDDAGILEFDPRSRTVSYHASETVERLLDAV